MTPEEKLEAVAMLTSGVVFNGAVYAPGEKSDYCNGCVFDSGTKGPGSLCTAFQIFRVTGCPVGSPIWLKVHVD